MIENEKIMSNNGNLLINLTSAQHPGPSGSAEKQMKIAFKNDTVQLINDMQIIRILRAGFCILHYIVG